MAPLGSKKRPIAVDDHDPVAAPAVASRSINKKRRTKINEEDSPTGQAVATRSVTNEGQAPTKDRAPLTVQVIIPRLRTKKRQTTTEDRKSPALQANTTKHVARESQKRDPRTTDNDAYYRNHPTVGLKGPINERRLGDNESNRERAMEGLDLIIRNVIAFERDFRLDEEARGGADRVIEILRSVRRYLDGEVKNVFAKAPRWVMTEPVLWEEEEVEDNKGH